MITQRERERERELKSKIAKLKTITNRTPEQEKKLQELKKKLAKLGNGSEERNSQKPTNYLPWIIGGGIALVIIIGAIIYFLARKKEPKKDYDSWK